MAAALVSISALSLLGLAACGGGSSTPPPFNSGTAAPPVAPGAPTPSPSPIPSTATQSQSISPSGGSIAATLAGQTVTVTVPAGAVAAASKFTVTVYAAGTGPHGTQSQARKTQSLHALTKTTQTFQSGDGEVVDVVVDAGGATLLVPLQLSVQTSVPLPSGQTPYVEGYNNGKFDDVAPMSYANGTYTSGTDPSFPGLSLASNTEYVVYTHAGTQTGDGTVTVSATNTGVVTGSTVTVSASEATLNGFPFLGRAFTYTSDNSKAGSVDPNSGVFTGGLGGVANVTATDKLVTSRSGTIAITTSPKPTVVTQPVSSSGGTITANIAGEVVVVTVPAGAVSSTTTFTVTAYAAGSGPHGVQSQAKGRQTQSLHPLSKTTQTFQGGDGEVIDVVIDAGGQPLLQPLTLAVQNAVVMPSGQNAFVEGYNNGTYDDVAPMSYANGTYTETADPTFPGLTLASNTEYVVYTHAGAQSGDGTVSLNSPPGPLNTGSTFTFMASEATANGFPYLGRAFTYTLDNGQAGTLDPNSGVFTAGALSGAATVTATDKLVTSRTAQAAVTAVSSRPATANLSASYTGTLTESDTNNAISGSPVTTTTNSTLATTVTTSSDGSGNTLFTAVENASSALRTIKTTTVSTVGYNPSGSSTVVRASKTVANDSNGSTYETDYGPNNGAQTVLPETSWSVPNNDGQLMYTETDPGINVGSDGTLNANIARNQGPFGAYTENTVDRDPGSAQPFAETLVGNRDFSGYITILAYGGGYEFSAPSGGQITYGFYPAASDTTLGNPPEFTATFASWIPASQMVPSQETDSITPGQSFDPSCSVPSKYGTTGALVQQQLTYADPVLGTLETRTTSAYDVPGPGTVCTVISDVTQVFYDYSGQEGFYLLVHGAGTFSAETINVQETLSLNSTNAVGTSSASRSTSSARGGIILPRSLAVARVQHLARIRVLAHSKAFRSHGGLKK